jgi:predicted nucleic acid-binding protein
MIYALDTNLLVYAEGIGDEKRCQASRGLVERLPPGQCVMPAQVLGELHRTLTRVGGRSADDAAQCVLDWSDVYEVADSTWRSFKSAFDLCSVHKISLWDALILSVSAEAGARVLLSEDFHHGFSWNGVTLVNPFLAPAHPLLRGLVD